MSNVILGLSWRNFKHISNTGITSERGLGLPPPLPRAGSQLRAFGSSARRQASRETHYAQTPDGPNTANLRTKILDFRGFDASRILILRDGTLMSMEFPGKFESTNLTKDKS